MILIQKSVHSDHMSSETWNRAGHFAFLLHGLKIEASPKGDFGPAVDVCNGWGYYGL